MLVAGPRADSFSVAATPNVSGNRYRGSDHRPVFATSSAQPDEDTETDRERLDRLILEVRRRLMEIERILRDADI
jgi:hypothetical protein